MQDDLVALWYYLPVNGYLLMKIYNQYDNRNMSIINNNISVSIDGKRLFSFKSLKLHQSINDHHSFELTLDLETGGNRYVHNLKDSAKWLGKKMTVRTKKSGAPAFLGVVTNVSLHRKNSDFGHILVSGYSTTYLLENGRNFHSWSDCTLDDIVKGLCTDAGVRMQVHSEYTETIDYICQYNESDFAFMKRLALQYNEWLYYNGTELIFGKPKLPEPVGLEFGRSLTSLDIGVQTLARPAKVFSYLAMHDQSLAEPTPDNASSGQDILGRNAFQASLDIFKKPANQYALPRINYSTEMRNYVRKKQEAEAAESHYVIGRSEHTDLTVGSIVKLTSSFLERVGSVTSESLGKFIIIDITHTASEEGYYSNEFRAIPAVTHYLPLPDVDMPIAEPQMAKVTRNDDKLGHGRVKVQMNWQTGNITTDWIRVMTPDGGSSDEVRTNRGFVFIPEVGDHVLVGFRHGDPNRPYVMGSLFNGTTGAGGFAENHLKSIRTRSGHAIELDDSPSSLGITIKDNKGNYIHIDSNGDNIVVNAEKDITFNAGETLTVNAKNMKLNIEENTIESVGGDKISTIGNKVSLEAMEKEEDISKDSNINIGGLFSQAVGEIVQSATSGDAVFMAEGKALLQGKDDARICKG